jgi:hypothetical protein
MTVSSNLPKQNFDHLAVACDPFGWQVFPRDEHRRQDAVITKCEQADVSYASDTNHLTTL